MSCSGVFFLISPGYRFIEICKELNHRGAEGIVLGCTEIPLLLRQENIDIPIINTLNVHAMAAVDFALLA